jgi:hypothetical protein
LTGLTGDPARFLTLWQTGGLNAYFDRTWTFSVGALSIAAAAFASAHEGDGNVIHACVTDGSGLLRIVDANEECRRPEQPLDWAQQGPPGDPGPPGPSGLGGPPNVLITESLPDCPLSGTAITCAARPLPPGSWLVTYKAVTFANSGIPQFNASCELRIAGVTVDTYPGSWGSGGLTIILSAVTTIEAESLVEVVCGKTLQLRAQRLTAIEVSASDW